MAMRKKLDKAAYDKLTELMKAEYISDGEDGFKLDLTDDEDVGPLKRALLREKDEGNLSKKRLAEVEEELASLNSNSARKAGDIATLEKQWQKKQDDGNAVYESRIKKLTDHTTRTLVDNVARDIAHKISSAPAIMLPHIRARIQADFEGDEPSTKILGIDGKVSAMTIEQLSAEFVANKDFASIITASKASGGAGKQTQKTNGGAVNNSGNSSADLSKLSPGQMVEHLKTEKANSQQD